MLPEIKTFYNQILNDSEGHRYRSWEHCFNAFNNPKSTDDYLTLHLAFYLASWGMYRGSSGLLWKDYTVHSGAISIIHEYSSMRVTSKNLFPEISDVQKCFSKLKNYYSGISYNNGTGEKIISATNTLISKIMLGAFGAVPAIDRYFKIGVSNTLKCSFNMSNLPVLYEFAQSKMNHINDCQAYISEKTGMWYPPMKILDMYFWQIGFELDNSTLK